MAKRYGLVTTALMLAIIWLSGVLPTGAAGAGPLPGPELKSTSACLMEASTGEVLFAKDADKALPLASITKIMTMLLVMEAIDEGRLKLTDLVTASEHATSKGGSQIYLEPGEVMSVETLLKSVAVASANDACVALAEHIAGTEEAFVASMNAKAKALGLTKTSFVNTNGLPPDDPHAEGNVASARDIAVLSRELMLRHPEITKYLTIWMEPIRDGKFVLTNTNKLVRYYRGTDGVKTGYTVQAKHCLAASAKRDGVRMVAVVMAAPDSATRFSEASKLMDLGFAYYKSQVVVMGDKALGRIGVAKGVKDSVGFKAKNALSVVGRKDDMTPIKTRLVIPQTMKAPVSKGQIVGQLIATRGGKTVGTVDLIATATVGKASFARVVVDAIRQAVRAPFKAKKK